MPCENLKFSSASSQHTVKAMPDRAFASPSPERSGGRSGSSGKRASSRLQGGYAGSAHQAASAAAWKFRQIAPEDVTRSSPSPERKRLRRRASADSASPAASASVHASGASARHESPVGRRSSRKRGGEPASASLTPQSAISDRTRSGSRGSIHKAPELRRATITEDSAQKAATGQLGTVRLRRGLGSELDLVPVRGDAVRHVPGSTSAVPTSAGRARTATGSHFKNKRERPAPPLPAIDEESATLGAKWQLLVRLFEAMPASMPTQ
jgi:hypothetical protein